MPRRLIGVETEVRPPAFLPASSNSTPEISPEPAANITTSPAPVKKVNVAEHPLAQHALMGLRNKLTAAAEFGQVSHQLLVLLALEATRTLPTKDDLIQTHSTTHLGQVLSKRIVLLSVSREGLGLAHKLAEFIPSLQVGSISLPYNSDSQGIEPQLHLTCAPALSGVRVLLFVPVVATGSAASQALKFIRRLGANDITLLSFLVSFQGLSRLQTESPDLNTWTAGIDSDWDSKRAPLTGLGNFADRLYG